MAKTLSILAATTSAALLLLASCSGGGSGGGPPGTGPTHGVVSGRISAGGVAVTGVVVTMGTRTATNGAGGSFTFADVAPGQYTVSITVPANFAMAGAQTSSRQVTVSAGQTSTADFGLTHQNPAAIVDVGLSGATFSPADLTIAPGTTVRWTNNDGQNHTVTPSNSGQSGVWARQSGSAVGPMFMHTFTVPGEYNYFCEPHQAQGMTAVVRVQ
jgi:plastocyanin